MADPKEDLRAALRARQSEEEAAERKVEREKAELKQAAARYEEEEREAVAYLLEVADVVLAVLAEKVPTEEIPITPERTGLGRLFPRKQVEGWRISPGQAGEYVLCPDGTVVHPQVYLTSPAPLYGTLAEQVEGSLRRVYEAEFSESAQSQTPSPWGEAFSWTSRPSRGDRAAAQERMRAHLEEMKREATEWLARLLHERGVSF